MAAGLSVVEKNVKGGNREDGTLFESLHSHLTCS